MSQSVYFTNPSTILQMQNQIASLSSYVSISSLTGTLASNTYNIWNLQAIRGFTGFAAQLYMPANPNNGDFVYIKDGLGNWGNQMYNSPTNNAGATMILGSGPLINFNGKTCKGACADGLLINYRQGSVSFTFNSGTNQWEGNSDLDLSKNSNFPGNNPDDPWTGWWMSYDKQTPPGGFAANSFDYQGVAFLYVDATVHPVSITEFPGTVRYPTTFAAVTNRTYELSTSTGTLILPMVTPYVGSRFTYPVLGSTLGFIMQSDLTTMTCIGSLIPNSTNTSNWGLLQNNGPIYKKLSTSPFNQSPNVSSIQAYDDSELLGGDFQENPVLLAKKMVYTMFAEDTLDCNDGGISVPSTATKPYAGLTYQNKPGLFANTGGWYAIEQELNTWITTGKTIVTPIINVMKSFSGPSAGTASFIVQGGGSTQLTDIYCGENMYCPPGSNITLSGFSGSWAGLNGYYPNGVSIWEYQQRKDIDSGFMDYKKLGSGQFTGSISQIYNKFLLVKDTYANGYSTGPYLAYSTGPQAGKGIDFNVGGATPTVSVTHQFTPMMSYNQFVAAIYAFYSYIYGSETHGKIIYQYLTNLKLGTIPTEWNKLGSYPGNIDASTQSFHVLRPTAEKSNSPQQLYNTKITASNGSTTFSANLKQNSWVNRNDPYSAEAYAYEKFSNNPYLYTSWTGATPVTSTFLSTQISNYTPLFMNYLTGAKFPLTGWGGTGVNAPSIEADPVFNQTYSGIYALYNSDYPATQGGSQFNFKLFNVESVATGTFGGNPNTYNPDSNYWMINSVAYSSSAATRAQQINANKLACVCGIIRPECSSGPFGARKLGYIKIGRSGFTTDTASIMNYPIYGPKSGLPALLTQKPVREIFSLFWSKFTEYLVRDSAVNSIIIDNRQNTGNGRPLFELAEFFGNDRGGFKQYQTRKGDGFADLIDPETLNVGAASVYYTTCKKFYVQNNRDMYPGCVFSGTGSSTTTAKKLVFLNNNNSQSFGSAPALFFLGDNYDKNIGSNTFVKYVGSSDPRFASSALSTTSNYDAPPSKNSKKIVVAGTTTNYPYMNFNAPSNACNLACCVTGPVGKSFWAHALIPEQGMDALTYQNMTGATGAFSYVFKGTAGGNALPEDWASTIYPDWGFIAPTSWNTADVSGLVGYDGFIYINDGRQQPTPSDWTTWRDRWLETAIKESYAPV